MKIQSKKNFTARPTDRICVLGAGAAGLSLARELESHGYNRVTVLERRDRVGGKCCTVQLEGRPHDLGAVGGTPWLYRDFRKLAKSVGVDHAWAPPEKVYTLGNEEVETLHTARQKFGLMGQAFRYVWLHRMRWRGVRMAGIQKTERELHQVWKDFVSHQGFQKLSERLRNSRIGFGYGFDHDIPAVYSVTCTNPTGVFGSLVGTGLYFWPGNGTQKVWERVAEELRDVRTGIEVTKIERGDVVRLTLKSGEVLEFDVLVLAFNPRLALDVLDASDEERELFKRIQTLDYRSIACKVEGLDAGKLGIGFIRDNLVPENVGRPLLWTKQYDDQNIFVFYFYGNETVNDEQAFEFIREDVARLGGKVVGGPLVAKRWDYFPHVKEDALAAGFYERMDGIQGARRTFYTGSYLTFEAIVFALANGREIARRMMD